MSFGPKTSVAQNGKLVEHTLITPVNQFSLDTDPETSHIMKVGKNKEIVHGLFAKVALRIKQLEGSDIDGLIPHGAATKIKLEMVSFSTHEKSSVVVGMLVRVLMKPPSKEAYLVFAVSSYTNMPTLIKKHSGINPVKTLEPSLNKQGGSFTIGGKMAAADVHPVTIEDFDGIPIAVQNTQHSIKVPALDIEADKEKMLLSCMSLDDIMQTSVENILDELSDKVVDEINTTFVFPQWIHDNVSAAVKKAFIEHEVLRKLFADAYAALVALSQGQNIHLAVPLKNKKCTSCELNKRNVLELEKEQSDLKQSMKLTDGKLKQEKATVKNLKDELAGKENDLSEMQALLVEKVTELQQRLTQLQGGGQ